MHYLEWPCEEILEELDEGVYFLDGNKKIIYWNKAAELITGFSRETALNQDNYCSLLFHINKHGTELCDLNSPLELTLQDGQPRSTELFFRHKDGYLLAVSLKVFVPKGPLRKSVGVICIFQDNSPREALFRELEQLRDKANFDSLTGIFNRHYGEILLVNKFAEFQKTGQPFAILFADIDHFKSVNDKYGHTVGDLVLKTVAKTLSSSVRTGDHVIRWGGEEILLILSGEFDVQDLNKIANKLRILVKQSKISFDTQTIQVTISIGTTFAAPDDTPDSLVSRSDQLMYRSKKAGRNRVTVG